MDDFRSRLAASAKRAGSWLCVGLDPDPQRFPDGLGPEDTAQFCLDVVEATAQVACAYKPNAAFFEALGRLGQEALEDVVAAIPMGIPVILDGKRNDIGNTARKYAEAAFDELGADAVTVNPYLGRDTVTPFAEYDDRGVFLLCRTSNQSAGDLQDLDVGGRPLWRRVAESSRAWDEHGNIGLVAGATYPDELAEVRSIVGDGVPLLIPGVGAQGADAATTLERGADAEGRYAVVNVGRSVLYAGSGEDWQEHVQAAAADMAARLPYQA